MTAHQDYHADRSRISASALKLFAESPRLFKMWEDGDLNRKPSDAMKAGTRLHEMVLDQPWTFCIEDISAPRRPTKAQLEAKKPSEATLQAIEYWAKRDLFLNENSLDEISVEEYNQSQLQQWAAREAFPDFLNHHGRVIEQRMDFEIDGVPCKAKPDLFVRGSVIFDLKNTRNAGARPFASQAIALGYHIQAAFYRRAVESATGERLPFVFGAVESKPRQEGVYLCQLHKCTDAFLAAGEAEIKRLMADIKTCRENDNWPDFNDAKDYDGMVALDAPYYLQDEIEIDDVEL